jgi:hypothetical protein
MGLVHKSDDDFWYGIEFLRIGWNSGEWYLFTNQFHLSNDADINVDILLIIVLKSRSRSDQGLAALGQLTKISIN